MKIHVDDSCIVCLVCDCEWHLTGDTSEIVNWSKAIHKTLRRHWSGNFVVVVVLSHLLLNAQSKLGYSMNQSWIYCIHTLVVIPRARHTLRCATKTSIVTRPYSYAYSLKLFGVYIVVQCGESTVLWYNISKINWTQIQKSINVIKFVYSTHRNLQLVSIGMAWRDRMK